MNGRLLLDVPGALDVHDCSTCEFAAVHDQVLQCDEPAALVLGSPVLNWLTGADLDGQGFPERSQTKACPGWRPAWGNE